MPTFSILPNIILRHPDTKYITLSDFYDKYSDIIEYPVGILAFDITQLNKINQDNGTKAGNKVVSTLAQLIQIAIPEPIYLAQDFNAKLLAIVPHSETSELKKKAKFIQKEFKDLVFGIGEAHNNSSINMAIDEALESARIQQILNPSSKKHESLFALLTMMKNLDKSLENHVQRTQELSIKIAEKMDLSWLEQSQLQLTCILHDVGKLFVPQEILQKPGALTSAEMTQIKQHAQKGADFLLKMPSFESIALFVKYHHERFDGKGYPEGISGRTIPLLSRIVSLVDSYDAMAHDRIYRKALSEKEIVDELLENMGKQFDPHLVSILIAMIETGELNTRSENTLCSS